MLLLDSRQIKSQFSQRAARYISTGHLQPNEQSFQSKIKRQKLNQSKQVAMLRDLRIRHYLERCLF